MMQRKLSVGKVPDQFILRLYTYKYYKVANSENERSEKETLPMNITLVKDLAMLKGLTPLNKTQTVQMNNRFEIWQDV